MPRFIFSASPNEGSQSQMLRPRMLNEYVFPNVGLIMYGFFWIKYGLWLQSQGLDPNEQSELLLWAEYPDGTVDFNQSILYYSILLEFSNANASNIPGKDITRDWLFTKQPAGTDQYERVVEELESVARNPEMLSGKQVTEAVVAPWFRTRCQEQDIELPARLENRLDSALSQTYSDDREQMEALIKAFVGTLGELCYRHPSLHEKFNTSPIAEPFDLTTMLWKTEDPAREQLANRRVKLTQGDVDALFSVLKTFPQGIRLLHSFCFMTYIGPDGVSDSRLRDIHNICLDKSEEIIDKAESDLNQNFDENVAKDIVATSYYYELNYFLAEAETIARKLLKNRRGLIRVEEIEEFLESTRGDLPVGGFEEFVASQDSTSEYLPGLIEKYDTADDAAIVSFLTTLLEGIESGKQAVELLCTLLIHEETLSEFDSEEGIYRIEQTPDTTSTANFYGTSSMLDYTEELLEGAVHD